MAGHGRRESMKKKYVIGVTGALASGKTTVAGMLAGRGAVRIDADKISHELLKNAAVRRAIGKNFGKSVLKGGKVDRKALGAVVFKDPKKNRRLNAIVHPLIKKKIREEIRRAKKSVVVLDAPLLIESGMHKEMDEVVLVTCGKCVSLKRAVSRGIPGEMAMTIMGLQMPLFKKKRYASYVINNSKSKQSTKKGVSDLWKKIQKRRNQSR